MVSSPTRPTPSALPSHTVLSSPGFEIATSHRFSLSPFVSHSSALFCLAQFLNPFRISSLRTLCTKHPGWHTPRRFCPAPEREVAKRSPITPFVATLTSHSQVTENPGTLSPVFATLTRRVTCKPFVCHSYTKQRGWVLAMPPSVHPARFTITRHPSHPAYTVPLAQETTR
jgi:hypothetical protein